MTYRRVVLVLIAAIAITVACLAQWPYMWEGEFLGKWSTAVAVLSLAGTLLAYSVRQREKEAEEKEDGAEERERISKNMYGELEDAQDALSGKKYPEDLLDVNIRGNVVTIANRFLNHDVYDSLVYSGKINGVRYELQQEIQNAFRRVKDHNRYLMYVGAPTHSIDMTSVEKCYMLLGRIDAELVNDIPNIMKRL